MNFHYPDFLWALLAVMVPVIIHLFTFRRYKTVYFSNVRFLGNIKRSTRKRTRIKHLIVMLLRMLALAALVLAFAMPYLPEVSGEKASIENEVALFVDNSFSMESVNEKGPLLEEAKSNAIEIVNSFPAGTRFYVFTNDFHGRDRFPKSKEEAIRSISSVEVSPRVTEFRKIAGFQYQSDFHGVRKLYVISDFQANCSDLSALQADTVSSISLVRIPAIETGNLYIDSCRFVSPVHRLNQKEELETWVANRSNDDLSDITIKLVVNDSLTAVANVAVKANSRQKVILKFTNSVAGARKGRLMITDYPVVYDNEFLLSWNVEKQRDVLAILGQYNNETEKIITALLGDDSFIDLDLVKEGEVKVSEIPDYATILLVNLERYSSGLIHELKKYADGGGSLVLFPSTEMGETNLLLKQCSTPLFQHFDTLDAWVEKINFDHPVYKEVFREQQTELSPIKIDEYYHWKISPSQKGESLLIMNNRQPALFSLPVNSGNLSVFPFPLQHNSFTRHSLFVASLYNLLIYSRHHDALWHTLGESAKLTVSNGFSALNNLMVTDLRTGEQFIPDTWMNAENKLQVKVGEEFADAGFYQVGDSSRVIAMNYDRKESDLHCLLDDDLQHEIDKYQLENVGVVSGDDELSTVLESQSTQRNLWRWMLVLAVLLLMLEGVGIRFWK